MTIILVLVAMSTLIALGLVLYLVYLETAIDLPPSDKAHHRRAAHPRRPVQDASNLHYAAVRRVA
jgi:hypothetical protein